ncbi:MAG: hypothetical protein J7L96_02240 [Bacteroidales bacterium]|nr:hypothetical protein [Bacteroidales bacterium]
MQRRLFWVLLFVLLFQTLDGVCQKSFKYIFLGHTYEWYTGGSKVDPRLEELDFSSYDRIWLGGDICSEASLNFSTLEYIDSIFDISAPGNHWALGNHDTRDGNIEWIEELTGRNTFYTYYDKAITTIVMNTCLTPYQCEDLEKQFLMIKKVCDTVEYSSHLVVLMHHAIWDSIPGLPDPSAYSHTDFPFWNARCKYVENNTFRGQIYPILVAVQHRGVQVICITGDIGGNGKKFEAESPTGVVFLGCGLNNTYFTDLDERARQPRDQVLIFSHDPASRSLTWVFRDLNDLLDN